MQWLLLQGFSPVVKEGCLRYAGGSKSITSTIYGTGPTETSSAISYFTSYRSARTGTAFGPFDAGYGTFSLIG